MKKKPTVLFINRCYWPDSEATGQLLTDLCEDLADRFDVHVVCGAPNTPTTTEFRADGIEVRNGVTLHRLTHTRFAKRVPTGRLINLLSFSRQASNYLRRLDLDPAVVVSETDPFLLPIVVARYARRSNLKVVCYLQDIYPDVAEAIGKVHSGWLTRQIRSRLKAAYDQSDRIVVLGECMKSRLASPPWSVDVAKMRVLPNWADCQTIAPVDSSMSDFRQQHDLVAKFVVMHSGNMGLTQQLDFLIDATRHPAWPDEAVLLLIGDGAARESLQSQAASIGNDRVRFLPYQPRQSLGESLSAADLHVVSMHPKITGCLCPSKLYGIFAAGRPVLAIADDATDLWRTVSIGRLGWTCPPKDAGSIAQAIARAVSERAELAMAGDRARAIALASFDRPVVTRQFSELLDDLLSIENPK